MKRSSRTAAPQVKVALFLFAGLAAANLPNFSARASTELDRQFGLETIGFLRSSDNMDGLFADYVAAAYRDYFAGQTRFILQDLSKADAVLTKSNLPYSQVIEDPAILAQVARTARSESMLRTKISKEGKQYRFHIEWLHAPKIDLIATETFTLEEPQDGRAVGLGDIQTAIQSGLDRLIDKVPFKAMVTGRDNQSITINMGAHLNLRKGDMLVVATLDEVKRHPLLKTIVEWRLTPVGKVEIEQVDEGIAFGHVVEEEPKRQIGRYQKVTQILPYQEAKAIIGGSTKTDDETPVEEIPPSLGWVGVSLIGGFHDRQISTLTGTTSLRGSGFYGSARANGEVWFTKEFFADLGFEYGFGTFSQTNVLTGIPTGAGGVAMSQFAYKLNAGYTFLTTGDFFGPKAWVKLGYRNTAYNYPLSASELTAPIAFGSIFAGLGGSLPIRFGFGVEANFEYGLLNFSSGLAALSVGTTNGSTQVDLYVGAYYRYSQRISIRAGLSVVGTGADFSGGYTLGQKYISFAPQVQYAF